MMGQQESNGECSFFVALLLMLLLLDDKVAVLWSCPPLLFTPARHHLKFFFVSSIIVTVLPIEFYHGTSREMRDIRSEDHDQSPAAQELPPPPYLATHLLLLCQFLQVLLRLLRYAVVSPKGPSCCCQRSVGRWMTLREEEIESCSPPLLIRLPGSCSTILLPRCAITLVLGT